MDAYIEWARREIEDATRGLSPAQLMSAPSGKWTPVQILEHLLMTYRSTANLFDRIRASAAPVPSPTLKQRAGIFLITVVGYFPEGRKSPVFAEPRGTADPATIVKEMLEQLSKMDHAIAEAQAVKGSSRPIAAHPILGPLTPSQWRRFHLAHTRHHMKQVRARAAFSQSASAA